MFEEQIIQIRASSLDDLHEILIQLKEAGKDFASQDETHKFDLMVDHEQLMVGVHLYKD